MILAVYPGRPLECLQEPSHEARAAKAQWFYMAERRGFDFAEGKVRAVWHGPYWKFFKRLPMAEVVGRKLYESAYQLNYRTPVGYGKHPVQMELDFRAGAHVKFFAD